MKKIAVILGVNNNIFFNILFNTPVHNFKSKPNSKCGSKTSTQLNFHLGYTVWVIIIYFDSIIAFEDMLIVYCMNFNLDSTPSLF